MPRAIPLALAVVFLAPLALAEHYGDPMHDEVIGFPPGPAVAQLAGCQSPSADIVGVSIFRQGVDIVTRVSLLDRDAPHHDGVPPEGPSEGVSRRDFQHAPSTCAHGVRGAQDDRGGVGEGWRADDPEAGACGLALTPPCG